MTTTSNTDIQQLKEFISDRFNQLDGKIDEVKDDLKNLSSKVESIDKRLIAVETKVDSVEKRFSTVESKLPDISEKFGELKNWRQIAFIIIAAVVGWFARSGKT
jgi:archaellum component FlaC